MHVTIKGVIPSTYDRLTKDLEPKHWSSSASLDPEGFWDIVNITDAPIIATHSNSRNLCDVSRNLTDDMFREICNTSGVVGINFYPDFLGNNANIDTICDHIFHFLEMDPNAEHISLGGDLDGIDYLPQGFNGVQDYTKISDRLLERGLTADMVYNIFWNNALGVFKKCCT